MLFCELADLFEPFFVPADDNHSKAAILDFRLISRSVTTINVNDYNS